MSPTGLPFFVQLRLRLRLRLTLNMRKKKKPGQIRKLVWMQAKERRELVGIPFPD